MMSVQQASLSADLVAYLRETRQMSLREIGEVVGLSESFVSRVANGQRRFTLEHLDRFEQALGQPLPLLLLEARWADKVTDETRELFQEGMRLLRAASDLAAELDRGDAGERKRSQKRTA